MAPAIGSLRAAVGLALLALAGCAGAAPPASEAPQPSLAKACAVRPCQCLSTNIPFFLVRESSPIRWLENGDASCPEGFKLVLSDEKQ
jgi:hypothetical protein